MLDAKHRTIVTGVTLLLGIAVAPLASAQVAADGRLDNEILLSLDANLNGVPDVLEGRLGVALLLLDNHSNAFPRGDDGFRDAGVRPDEAPDPGSCPPFVQCLTAADFSGQALSPLNIGKLTVIFIADSDGIVVPGDPSSDDSFLYAGLDIYNGDARTISTGQPPLVEGRDFWRVDVVDTGAPGLCNDGVRDLDNDRVPDDWAFPAGGPADHPEPNGVPNYGVPFDIDGDGDPDTVFRWAGLLPGCDPATTFTEDQYEYYQMQFFTCARGAGAQFIGGTKLAELHLRVRPNSQMVELLEESPVGLLDTWETRGVVDIPDAWIETYPARGVSTRTLLYSGGNPHSRDVEFIIRHIESVAALNFPENTAFENRLLLANGGVRVIADTQADSAEDRAAISWSFPVPQVEVRKLIRCVSPAPLNADSPDAVRIDADDAALLRVGLADGQGNADSDLILADALEAPDGRGPVGAYFDSVVALPGSIVEFYIEVENTGNVPISVVLQDALSGPITIVPGSLQASLVRPADPAQNGPINYDNAATKNPVFNPDFFDDPLFPGEQGFLTALDGTTRWCLGILNGVSACTTPRIDGDKVLITFRATVNANADFCTTPQSVDFTNKVTARGYLAFDPETGCPDNPSQPGDTIDQDTLIDTPRELGVKAISDGGNGISNTTATGDDEQVIPNGQSVNPAGQIVVNAGPNNVVDSTPGGDDRVGHDDNVVWGNVLCRRMTFQKDVQYCPSCAIPGGCTPLDFADSVTIPAGIIPTAANPLCIRYRYRAQNTGEVRESITIRDNFLCDDLTQPTIIRNLATAGPVVAAAAGDDIQVIPVGQTAQPGALIILPGPDGILQSVAGAGELFASGHPHVTRENCDVCPGGGTLVDPGATLTQFCTVRITSEEGLKAFLRFDDRPQAAQRTCGSTTNLLGGTSEFCYTNCARATAVAAPATGVCDAEGLIEQYDSATVCRAVCYLDVVKTVECVDCATGASTGTARAIVEKPGGNGVANSVAAGDDIQVIPVGQPAPPGAVIILPGPNGVIDTSPVADEELTTLSPNVDAVPGSCVRFKVSITNRTTNEAQFCTGCRLTIADLLSPAANIVPEQGSGTPVFELYKKIGNTTVNCNVPAAFNVNGNPFDWQPTDCGAGQTFAPGDTLIITFRGRIPATASCTGAPNASNVVQAVTGYTQCPGGPSAFIVTGVPATATVDIKCVGLTCTKQWRAEWDSNADCQPGPGLEPGPTANDYTNDLDLRDVVFPVRLFLKVTATNTGEVPLDVTPSDTILCSDCVRNTPGITIESSEICSILPDPPNEPVVKTVPAGGTQTWTVVVRVDNAAAARAIAQNCDLAIDNQPLIFKNRVTMTGVPSGVCPGNSVSGGPCEAQIRVPEPCTLTIDKKVKCADDPDAAYAASVEALPGARLRYRIQVCNASTLTKIPRICLTDTLCQGDPANCACRTWFDANSVTANIAGADVTNCVKPTFKVDGTEVCFTFPACRPAAPWLAPGECLTITFDVVVPPGFSAGGSNCQPGPNPDCRNVASAKGFTEACPPTNATPCTAGPVQADINVKVPRIECEKAVCVDYGNDGTCSPPPDSGFLNQVNVDCNANFPFTLLYRYTVRNAGETGLTNVTICDLQLIADICQANAGLPVADQIVVVACDLCDGACCPPTGSDGCRALPDLPNCGDTATATCRVRIPSRAAWLALAALDTDNDPNCYTNSGQATAQVRVIGTTLCDFEANVNVSSAPCSAVVCVSPPCNLTVHKKVRCTDTCNGTGVGAFEDGPRDVVPGAGFEYEIVVTNNDGASYSSTICALRLTDTLVGPTTWVAATWIPCEYKATPASAVVNIPQCFKADGTPYVVNLPTPMQTGGTLTAQFKPCVVADPAPGENTIDNTIVVEGAPNCPTAGPIFCCTSNDTVRLNIKRPSVRCLDKRWSVLWDSDGDCVPGPALLPLADLHDLGTADGGEAIVFPAKLCLQIDVENNGAVPLSVTVSDPALLAAVAACAGVTFDGPCEVNPPVAKTILPGATASWTCCIRVPTAQHMRCLAANDGLPPSTDFQNVPTVSAVMVSGGQPICVPPAGQQTPIGGDVSQCTARIIPPPPCELTVVKNVVCLTACDGTGVPTGLPEDAKIVAPGACARFIIEITNTSPTVKIPRLRIRDTLSRPGWFKPGTVQAALSSPATNVNACVATKFSGALPTAAWQCYWFGPFSGQAACRPADPWLNPGEKLTITFDVQVPADFAQPGLDPDLLNTVQVEGFSEVCYPNVNCLPPSPTSPDQPCDTDQDTAQLNVLVPQVTCYKSVAADYGNNGSYDVPAGTDIEIDQSDPAFTLPVRLRYEFSATNLGEVALDNVNLCDTGLVAHAVNAGAAVGPCDLCSPPCDGVNDECRNVGTLAPGATATVACEILITSDAQLQAFLELDLDGKKCHLNQATAIGTPSYPTGACVPSTIPPVNSQYCEARICTPGICRCPPIVKAVADIWNQNEIRMSGTERCLCAWDETLLSRWTLESGLPNHFLRQFLQTDRGRARIDGVRSVVVCGPESQAWPLLGVSMKFLKFGSDVTQAGVPLTAVGEERGLILVPGASVPRGKGAGDALTQLERMKLYDSGVPDETPGGRSVENDVPFTRRADTTEKGSFLAFVKVEIKWDSSGRLIQDTFIQLTNDGSSDVFVKVFQVNGNGAVCNAIDNTIVLTHDEPAYWAASTGQPKGVSAFTLLDPQGDPDTDPHNPGGRVLRGYIIAFAVNSVDAEIRWNHLSGAATIVNYALRSAWEYNPWSFRAWSAEEGQVLAGNPGQLEFDGVEYDWAPARLLLEFFAPGTRLQSSSGKSVVVEDTDLTLWAMFRDLTEF